MDDLKARLRGMDGDSMSIKTLDEAADRIEQLERERDEALNQLDSERYTVTIRENRIATLYSRIEALELALTQSRAETAAVIERAAAVAFTAATGSNACAADRKIIATTIRALATPDQNAALDAVRAEAMREAAQLAGFITVNNPSDEYIQARSDAQDTILAAIKGAEA